MHNNFVRIHQPLNVTPAMASGVTKKLWKVADLVSVLCDGDHTPVHFGEVHAALIPSIPDLLRSRERS
jgi:hypothetical protein